MDINQCAARGTGMFAETHRCRRESTMCEHLPGGGFRRGFYQCKCKERFHFPSTDGAADHFDGFDAEVAFLAKHRNLTSFNSYDQDFHCLPCGKGCTKCVNDSSCIVEYNILIRGIPLGIQSFCMTITIVLGFVIVRLRKAKVMITSMWVMMEILLLGALMLYSTVVAQYFEPTTMTCLIVPWFREVGFVVMYGALVLKLYRLLSEFQSRKAHRVHVRDKDLLKYLCCIIFVVLGYMAAWSAINMDHIHDGKSVLDVGRIDNGLQFTVCRAFWWDYVIETIELLFLFFGIYLCYCTRSAPSDYGEGRYISIALYNETIMCVLLYGSRHFLWLSLHPDYMFLLYFLRCQFTVTVTLILVLGPKLWFAHRPPEDDHFRSRTYSTSDVHDSVSPETMKLSVAISSNGDVDVGEVNLAEMDPEDIRSELKRLYTQLQVYKTKTMRKDNPHISKRRGGRKQTHRRFSLQAFHHKHRHHHEQDHDHELSKTPEDSTNSAEMTIQMEGVSVTEDHCHESGSRRDRDREGRSAPYVTFKSGVK